MTTSIESPTVRGGAWLLDASDADSVFTPERLTDEHKMIAQTAAEFGKRNMPHSRE